HLAFDLMYLIFDILLDSVTQLIALPALFVNRTRGIIAVRIGCLVDRYSEVRLTTRRVRLRFRVGVVISSPADTSVVSCGSSDTASCCVSCCVSGCASDCPASWASCVVSGWSSTFLV